MNSHLLRALVVLIPLRGIVLGQCGPLHAADDGPYTTSPTTSVMFDVGSNDMGTLPTYHVVTGPQHGVLNQNGPASQMTYTPTGAQGGGDYCGPDSITYQIMDACGNLSNIATVQLTVTGPAAPVAHDDSFNWIPSNVLYCAVLQNDTGIGAFDPQIQIVTRPLHGTAQVDMYSFPPQVQYTADQGYCGDDSFTYYVQVPHQCGVSNTATVHLVSPAHDCNDNGLSDADDIATGFSHDANLNGVPDECELNATPSTTAAVSVRSGGQLGNGSSYNASLSADGRHVAFTSEASDLVPGDTNSSTDIFVHDRLADLTERVSVSSSGDQANGPSYFPSISADGRYVAFSSDAYNLIVGDTNANRDVFLHDRLTGLTSRVSVSTSNAQGNGSSDFPVLSGNGHFVAFLSYATIFVGGVTNGDQHVFRHDIQTGETRLVSVALGGLPGNSSSFNPSISADGQFIAFDSLATDLVLGDINNKADVFAFDMQLNLMQRMSVSSSGAEGNDHTFFSAISGDGHVVAFISLATNLVPNDTNSTTDVFSHNRLSAQTSLVSVGLSGAQANGASDPSLALSSDGRYVAFLSGATNLVAGDSNGVQDVFVRDTQISVTTRVSVNSGGFQVIGQGWNGAAISSDGRDVAFSGIGSLAPGHCPLQQDVFVYESGIQLPMAFCFGDGTGTPCPCGNNGSAGNGCSNSANAAGGNLTATGNASVSADTFVLIGSGMPSTAPVLYFQTPQEVNGGSGVPFGDGLRCIGGPPIRLGTAICAGGSSHFPTGSSPSISVKGMIPPSGAIRYYSARYRNPANYCTPDTFNYLNALQVVWVP